MISLNVPERAIIIASPSARRISTSAEESDPLGSVAQVATVLNDVVAFSVGGTFLELHRLLTYYAANETDQWAFIVVQFDVPGVLISPPAFIPAPQAPVGMAARGQSFGIPSWTGNESISRNPSGVPILDSFTAHGAFKGADLARLHDMLAAVINRAALTSSMGTDHRTSSPPHSNLPTTPGSGLRYRGPASRWRPLSFHPHQAPSRRVLLRLPSQGL